MQSTRTVNQSERDPGMAISMLPTLDAWTVNNFEAATSMLPTASVTSPFSLTLSSNANKMTSDKQNHSPTRSRVLEGQEIDAKRIDDCFAL